MELDLIRERGEIDLSDAINQLQQNIDSSECRYFQKIFLECYEELSFYR
jgi:hypothetical protein